MEIDAVFGADKISPLVTAITNGDFQKTNGLMTHNIVSFFVKYIAILVC